MIGPPYNITSAARKREKGGNGELTLPIGGIKPPLHQSRMRDWTGLLELAAAASAPTMAYGGAARITTLKPALNGLVSGQSHCLVELRFSQAVPQLSLEQFGLGLGRVSSGLLVGRLHDHSRIHLIAAQPR